MATWDKYEAVVTRNDDPDKLGRVRAKCRALAGAKRELPFWIPPYVPAHSVRTDDAAKQAGFFFIPAVNSPIIIEVMTNSGTDKRRMESLLAHPVARYYPAPYTTKFPPPSEFATDYPQTSGIITPGGHVLTFDDKPGSERIHIHHSKNPAYVTIGADGNLTIHSAHVLIDEGADQHLVRGEELKTWLESIVVTYFNNHIHPTGVGPSGVPQTPMTNPPSTVLSSNHKLK